MAEGSEPAGGFPAAQQGTYAYCIIVSRQPRSFGPVGIGGRGDEVHTVHFEDLAAVVSDTPLAAYDPTRENVLAHEQVNETVMRESTVLPMAFGTLFRSEQDVVELMRTTYDTLRDTLRKIEGKAEFGLKASWDRDRAIAAIEQENEAIRRLKEQAGTAEGNAAFHAGIQLGQQVEAALNARAESYVRDIHAALQDVAVASQANKPIGEKMILNAAFLVERAGEERFVQEVERVGDRYEGELSFKLSGPWPPYNFVRVRLKIGPNGNGDEEGAGP